MFCFVFSQINTFLYLGVVAICSSKAPGVTNKRKNGGKEGQLDNEGWCDGGMRKSVVAQNSIWPRKAKKNEGNRKG